LPGSSIKYSREDHVHPTDTTRAAASAVTAATLAEYLSNNPQSRMVTSGTLWSAAGPVTIVDTSGTITCDFSTGIDFSVSVTAAGRTLANPVNVKSQKGLIYLFANAAGASITTWGNQWIFPGGVKPTLSANGARDAISYSYFAGINLAFCSFQPDFR
jgi:hypothetical protein